MLLPLFEVRSPRLSMARCLFSLCCFSDVTFSLAFLLKSQVSFFSHFLVPLPCPVGILTLSPLVYCLALPRESKLPGRGSLFSSLLIFVSQGCYNQVPKPGWLKTKLECLLVVEAGSLKSRCQQGHIFSDSSRGGSFLVPSSLWGLLAILVFFFFFLTFFFVLEYSLSTIL